jgi:hypothetical protein
MDDPADSSSGDGERHRCASRCGLHTCLGEEESLLSNGIGLQARCVGGLSPGLDDSPSCRNAPVDHGSVDPSKAVQSGSDAVHSNRDRRYVLRGPFVQWTRL